MSQLPNKFLELPGYVCDMQVTSKMLMKMQLVNKLCDKVTMLYIEKKNQ